MKVFPGFAFSWNGIVFFLVDVKSPISTFAGAPLLPGSSGHMSWRFGRQWSLLGRRQGCHADSAILYNGKVPRPIRSAVQRRHSNPSNVRRGWRRDAEQDDPARGREPGLESQLAEILVKCDKDPIVGACPFQDFAITAPRCIVAHPDDIVAVQPQGSNGISGKVLVGKDAHGLRSHQGVDLLGPQRCAGIAQAGLDILVG